MTRRCPEAIKEHTHIKLHHSVMKMQCKCNLFTHGAPKSSLSSFQIVRSRTNWNLEMLVFEEGGKKENPEKNSRSRDKNQQQT